MTPVFCRIRSRYSRMKYPRLAVKPKLKPEELAKIIIETGDRTPDGRRNLMNPKKAIAAVRAN